MKHTLSVIFLLISVCSYSQPAGKESRFEDSLTLRNHRTWFREDGGRFTKVNGDCSYGMEITFYKKDRKAILRRCEQGAWKESTYKFRVATEEENHYVEILDDNNKLITKLEVQMLGSSNHFTVELTYYNLGSKDYYTLVSNEH